MFFILSRYTSNSTISLSDCYIEANLKTDFPQIEIKRELFSESCQTKQRAIMRVAESYRESPREGNRGRNSSIIVVG